MEEPGGLQSMGSLESDMTERLHFHFSLHALEKEMEGGVGHLMGAQMPSCLVVSRFAFN